MREEVTRTVGLVLATAYAAALVWLLAAQPRTMAEAVGGLAAGLGVYAIDAQAFADGLAHFRAERFAEARTAFARADPASQDALTQFYIAYSRYRQGWHRTHRDDALYRQALEDVERAMTLARQGRLVVDDPDLGLRSAEELKAELERGLQVSASDFNPLRLFEERK